MTIKRGGPLVPIGLAMLLAVWLPALVAGQAALGPGSRIRVRLDHGQSLTGSLVGISSDSLIVEAGTGSGRRAVARNEVARLDVFRDRHHPILRDALIGAALGAAIGASAGSMGQICRPDDPPTCEPQGVTRGEAIKKGAAIYGGVGLAAGIVSGIIGRDRWTGPIEPLVTTSAWTGEPRALIGARVAIRR